MIGEQMEISVVFDHAITENVRFTAMAADLTFFIFPGGSAVGAEGERILFKDTVATLTARRKEEVEHTVKCLFNVHSS